MQGPSFCLSVQMFFPQSKQYAGNAGLPSVEYDVILGVDAFSAAPSQKRRD